MWQNIFNLYNFTFPAEIRRPSFDSEHMCTYFVCRCNLVLLVVVMKAQWSLYLPHSGHYTYRTVATIRTAQWSLYVPHSGHYTYRTVVTIRTAQWSLYVPHTGHYTYRTVATIRTAQWSLYVPHSGYYTYRKVATIRTAPSGLTFNNVTFMFVCFVWIWE